MTIWSETASNGSTDVYAQCLDSSGNLAGEKFLVNSTTDGYQGDPVVAGLSNGGFVVAWQSKLPGEEDYDIYAQYFDDLAKPAGQEFQVNSATQGHQHDPAIAGLTDGEFVIAWQSGYYEPDNQAGSIHAQLFEMKGDAVAQDNTLNSNELQTLGINDFQMDAEAMSGL